MQSKISFKLSLAILVVAVIASFSMIIFLLVPEVPAYGSGTQSISLTKNQTAQNSVVDTSTEPTMGLPVRLKIPKIGVDAVIEYAGLTPQGAVGVPRGPTDAAWFDLSPRPGETGSSVIVGHYGWKDGIPAVFDDLYKLRPGDQLSIESEGGTTTTFVVYKILTYNQSENVPSVFNSNDGGAHLNLITCEGTWNKFSQSYSNRLVVFTDKE